ncbi:hypothetical protein LTR28_011983 [Elasticomyces elasticus]|nr:hypothetical protein LTR28_011983 [Elasticomyces elasticus]
MATVRASLSHEERTAGERRASALVPVTLSRIERVNESVRLLKLQPVDRNRGVPAGLVAVKFRAGQWLDVFIPGLRKAGGFTITSTPGEAQLLSTTAVSNTATAAAASVTPPYLELAIQQSANPPAQWLWRPTEEVLGRQLVVRVGGSFHWPPLGIPEEGVDRLVLVAGGVGIKRNTRGRGLNGWGKRNSPLISILAHLAQSPAERRPKRIHFLYSTRPPPASSPDVVAAVLFLPRLVRLRELLEETGTRTELSLFLTGVEEPPTSGAGWPRGTRVGRITRGDLLEAVGEVAGRAGTLAYVCGPPRMTDQVVEFLQGQEGMKGRVLCEKWW